MRADQYQTNHDRLKRLATLVKQLRAVQKAGGKGYTSTAVSQQAGALEQEVDAAVTQILGSPPTP